jgi:hypothetical protein
MFPLFVILFGILNGDRLRKPTPAEERFWAGVFFIIPVYFGVMALSIRYEKHFWDTAGALSLTLAAAVVISVLFFGAKFWGGHVPAKVSWVLATVAWPVILFIALTGRLA